MEIRSPSRRPRKPSIEDVLLGAIPGLPKVHLHNPVLAYENGDDFLKFWYEAEAGRLDPFVLVVEGSIPNEKIKKEGYWAGLGTESAYRPAHHHQRVDRSADSEGARRHCLRNLRHLRRHSRDGRKSDRLHGTGRLPRMGLEIQGRSADRECSRDVRCSRTTSWKRSSICSTRWPVWRR